MSRGPRLEQIEDADYPTFRIERERFDGTRQILDGCELLESSEATAKMRAYWPIMRHVPHTAALCVVNERTGFTRDRISRG